MKNMDCLSVAADRGHVYATESVVAIEAASNNLFAITALGAKRYSADRYFLVLDAVTGNIIQRILVGPNSRLALGLMVPGANNDVFFVTADELIRIYYDPSTAAV